MFYLRHRECSSLAVCRHGLSPSRPLERLVRAIRGGQSSAVLLVQPPPGALIGQPRLGSEENGFDEEPIAQR